MEYLGRAIDGCKPFLAMLLSGLMYVMFPEQAFLTAFYGVVGAMILDIVTKYIALSKQNGGFMNAVRTRKIYSRTFWDGTKTKIISYMIIFILAGLSYRVTMLTQVSVFLATVIYSMLFLRETQSILENLVDAGADLGWLVSFVKKKQTQILEEETVTVGNNQTQGSTLENNEEIKL